MGFALPLNGELGLFDGKSMIGVLDALFFGALPEGQSFVRNVDSGRWEVR